MAAVFVACYQVFGFISLSFFCPSTVAFVRFQGQLSFFSTFSQQGIVPVLENISVAIPGEEVESDTKEFIQKFFFVSARSHAAAVSSSYGLATEQVSYMGRRALVPRIKRIKTGRCCVPWARLCSFPSPKCHTFTGCPTWVQTNCRNFPLRWLVQKRAQPCDIPDGRPKLFSLVVMSLTTVAPPTFR